MLEKYIPQLTKDIDFLIAENKESEAFHDVQFLSSELLRILTVFVLKLNDYEKAMRILKFIAEDLDSNGKEIIYSNIAAILNNVLKCEEALDWNSKACDLIAKEQKIVRKEILTNRISILSKLAKDEEAVDLCKQSLQFFPDCSLVHHNLGLSLGYLGKFDESLPELEWRFKVVEGAANFRNRFKQPDWQGELVDKLLIYNEQGIGDLIQYIRYLPKINAKKIYLECPIECVNLIKLFNLKLENKMEIIERKEDYSHLLPEVDKVVSICSLPFIFKTNLNNISGKPYIKVPEISNEYFSTDKKKIGITWAGSTKFNFDWMKLCLLKYFVPLVNEKIQFYNLQKGEMIREIPGMGSVNIEEGKEELSFITPKINDFLDTAQVIQKLDMVISVDTAVAHLAGAMGKPTCLLLSYSGDWRWLRNRTDTPWYNSIKIFRQNKILDWTNVFIELKDYLDFSTNALP